MNVQMFQKCFLLSLFLGLFAVPIMASALEVEIWAEAHSDYLKRLKTRCEKELSSRCGGELRNIKHNVTTKESGRLYDRCTAICYIPDSDIVDNDPVITDRGEDNDFMMF